MDNNQILRKLRYIFDLRDAEVVESCALADYLTNEEEVVRWMKAEQDPELLPMSDHQLASFLNGFIVQKRGKSDKKLPAPEMTLNNNLILRKLKIALNLRTDDMIRIFEKSNRAISPHELSAFFRHPAHDKYRDCGDQYLRAFLWGMQEEYRGGSGKRTTKIKS